MAEEEEEEIMIMEKWITTLPQEIVMEILSWLPATSLVSSFTLVCKAWCTLIHDPDFINKMHLNRGAIHGGTSLIRKTRTVNIGTMDGRRSGNKLFQLKPPFNYEGFVIAPKINLDFDFYFDFYLWEESSRLVGSCNGLLLCLNDSRNKMLDVGIILLNPSTKKCKISPRKPIKRPSSLTSYNPATYGFGCYYNNYSITTIVEYKVVRIVHFYPAVNLSDPQSFQFQIDIYSMSSDSWRSLGRVEGFPHDVSEQFGLFLNEAVHWMGCIVPHGNVSYWDTIVSFNIRDEEFRQVPAPPCADVVVVDGAEYPYLNEYTILMNVRGCLGNAYFSVTKMMDVVLEIWVMKEYGIGESWTKEFVIRTSDSYPLRKLSGLYMFSRYMTCFLTGDDKILIEVTVGAGQEPSSRHPPPIKDYGRRILYDMNKKEIDGDFVMIDIPYEYRDDQVDYIETLVSLKSSSPLSSTNNFFFENWYEIY